MYVERKVLEDLLAAVAQLLTVYAWGCCMHAHTLLSFVPVFLRAGAAEHGDGVALCGPSCLAT